MPFLSTADQEYLRERLAQELDDDVRLLVFTRQPSPLFVPGREEPVHVRETQGLMEELVALSPKLHLEVHDLLVAPKQAQRYAVTQAPTIVALRGAPDGTSASDEATSLLAPLPTGDGRPPPWAGETSSAGATAGLIRFVGLPAGNEFQVLLEDVIDLSRGRTSLSESTREQLAQLQEPLHLQVFVTPT